MLDDRERGELEAIERALLADPDLQRRLRAPGARLRTKLATPLLVALVVFLAVAAVVVLALGLPLQAIVLVTVGAWPWSVLRRRLRRTRRRGPSTP